jgi:acetyl esterase/lipase
VFSPQFTPAAPVNVRDPFDHEDFIFELKYDGFRRACSFGCPPGQSSQGAPCAVMASCKVTKGGPPAILFYGTEDPLQDAGRDFAQQLTAAGTRAEFYTAAGQQHGFFNRFPDSPSHALVLRQTDLFLASLGYLKGNPTVGIPANTTAALHMLLRFSEFGQGTIQHGAS